MDEGCAVNLGRIPSPWFVVDLTRPSSVAFPTPTDAPGNFIDHGDGPSGKDVFVKATSEDAFCA